MKKLHLCFYELSEETQKELKQHIKNSLEINGHKNKTTNETAINELFDLNNAGADIDIYSWMG